MRLTRRGLLFCFATGLPALALAGPTRGIIARLDTSERGFLTLTVQNAGRKRIRFLDAHEGTAACNSIWRVEMNLPDGSTVEPATHYSPFGCPFVVTLDQGQKYRRKFQPLAYVDFLRVKEGMVAIRIHNDPREDVLPCGVVTKHPTVTFSSAPSNVDIAHLR